MLEMGFVGYARCGEEGGVMKEETLLDLVEQENIKSNNFNSNFLLESCNEFDDPAGWLVEVGFTTATDAYNFLNSAMFERLFENGYADKYRVVRACDNQIVYFKESEHVGG